MANVLGQLIVNLLANTASFESGLNAGAKQAKVFEKDVHAAFDSVGHTAEKIFGALGPLAGEVGEAFAGIASSASGLLSELTPLAGTLGPVGVGLAAIAAVATAGELAFIGLAIHAAEGTEHLGNLAKATGIGVDALSLLGKEAATKGIPLDTMALAMERMSKNAFDAASGTGAARVAFKALGVDVLDSNGHLKSAEDIFNQVAVAVAKMPDGTAKTAEVMKIMGRGAAELIPLLDAVGKHGEEMAEHFRAVGAGVNLGSLVAGAEKFKEETTFISAAFSAIGVRIENDLLPALTVLAEEFVAFFENNHEQILAFIDNFSEIIKWTFVLGDAFKSVFEFIGLLFESGAREALAFFNAVGAGLEAVGKVSTGDFSGAQESLRAGYAGLSQEGNRFITETVGIWTRFNDFKNSILNRRLPSGPFQDPSGGLPGGEGKADTTLERIRQRLDALRQEVIDWNNVASSGTQAENLIAEAVKKGNEEFGKLKHEAAKSPAALSLVVNNEDLIKSAGAESVFGAAIKKVVDDLDKQTNKFQEQSLSALALGAAYQQGGAAIASAALDEKFSADAAKIRVFQEVLDKLPPSLTKSSPIAAELADHIAQLTADMQRAKDAESEFLANSLTADLIKQGVVLQGMKPYVDDLNASYLQGELAVRQARIELQLYQFEQDQLAKGIVVTAQQKEAERAILQEADNQAYQGILAQEAARFSLNALYSDSILKLEHIREIIEGSGSSTLLIDAQIFDEQNRLLHQWDEAAIKVGTFQERVKGVLGELVIQGREAGADIAGAFLTAIDGIETQFAKLLTGQKANFKQVLQGLAESVTKAGIQEGVGKLAGSLGIHIPGLEARPDGSTEARALFVRVVNPIQSLSDSAGLGGVFGDRAKGFGGILGGLAGLAGSIFGRGSLPFTAGGAPTAIPGVIGAISKSFTLPTGLFPGLAEGGDVTPGRAYLVGERGPEIRTFGAPGQITPLSKIGGNSYSPTIVQNFNGIKDGDMLRRGAYQERAQLHRAFSFGRN